MIFTKPVVVYRMIVEPNFFAVVTLLSGSDRVGMFVIGVGRDDTKLLRPYIESHAWISYDSGREDVLLLRRILHTLTPATADRLFNLRQVQAGGEVMLYIGGTMQPIETTPAMLKAAEMSLDRTHPVNYLDTATLYNVAGVTPALHEAAGIDATVTTVAVRSHLNAARDEVVALERLYTQRGELLGMTAKQAKKIGLVHNGMIEEEVEVATVVSPERLI